MRTTTLVQLKVFKDCRFIEDIEKPMNDWLINISEKISSFEVREIKPIGDKAFAVIYSIDMTHKDLLEE